MIVLNDRESYYFNPLQETFNKGLLFGIQNAIRQREAEKEYQRQLKKLQKMYDLQMQKSKELAKFNADLENQQKQETIKRLLGTPQTTVTNLNEAFNPGNIQESIIQGMQNAKNQGLFGSPEGLLLGAVKNMPQLNLPKPQVKTQYKGGVLSDYANQNPAIANSIKAQVYGIQLPKIKESKSKYKLEKAIRSVDNKGNPVWKVPIFNETTGEIVRYETIPAVKQIQKGKIQVNESKPFIGEDGKPYFIREYIYPDGKTKREIKRYYDSKTANSANSQKKQKLSMLEKGISYIMKKYKLDKGLILSDEATAQNTIELIRKVNPEDARKLEKYYRKYTELVERNVGIKNEDPPVKPQNNPFSVFER